MDLFVIGPAGSGKSSFVKSFSEFLKEQNYSVQCVNLDPATNPLYKTPADIRRYVKTENVMDTFQLGINSALMKSVDVSLHYIDQLPRNADILLYDTPGQMELFIYSPSGRHVVERLSGQCAAGLFLMDLTIIQDPESFLSAVMQNVIVSLRLTIPTLTVFSKSDLASVDIHHLKNKISTQKGALSELLEKVMFFIEYTTLPQKPLTISNLTKEGFSDLFASINELFCACGDLS
jgi:GTPase SAR1 family protein